MNIVEYKVSKWAQEVEEITVEEVQESFIESFGKEVTTIWADIENSEISGCQFTDGTYGVFGCGMDMDGLDYDDMMNIINDAM